MKGGLATGRDSLGRWGPRAAAAVSRCPVTPVDLRFVSADEAREADGDKAHHLG